MSKIKDRGTPAHISDSTLTRHTLSRHLVLQNVGAQLVMQPGRNLHTKSLSKYLPRKGYDFGQGVETRLLRSLIMLN
jgi:hypothetical protein